VRTRHSPRIVLFDLDDTLFDHHHAARTALAGVHQAHRCFSRWPFEDFSRAHSRILEELHGAVVEGALGIDAAREERFRRLFAASGEQTDGPLLASTAAAYRQAYVTARRPVDGARDLLSALKPRVRIGIVSNNLREEQEQKIEHCGLAPFVDALVVSEEARVSKPDPAIFRIALERLDAASSEAVMIGDSWAADIEGARAAGIRGIWFNRSGGPPPAARETTGVITIEAFQPTAAVLEAIFPCVLA
jgi:putative hydrolase of the HAD superfamily